jgi:hypothetical protein
MGATTTSETLIILFKTLIGAAWGRHVFMRFYAEYPVHQYIS